MSLRILIDMNLSPSWLPVLQAAGWATVHWSSIGAPDADDQTIMAWARQNGHIVFTHDLDFGTCLAHSGDVGPSVFQVRTQDILPDRIGALVVGVIRQYESEISRGAIVVLDESRSRVRMLPIVKP